MSKTPRTLLENYLDASKTQTVKVKRNQHGGLQRTPPVDHRSVRPRLSRTPEPYIHSSGKGERHAATERPTSITPEPYIRSASKSRPQHDRVSLLRSKRRSVSSNNDVEETPRQLLQGFMESEDTTAPLVRYASRTSQGRLSSSQPALSSNSGRSSLVRPGNVTVDLDYDTPRTLLQRYVLNTTNVIDTPAPRSGIPQQQPSPDIPVLQDVYRTPSPFKKSSESDSIPSPYIVRGKTPRSARRIKEQFSLMENVNETVDDSMIPPTNPADYQVPSAFCSSDEESVILETQPSTQLYKRSFHQKGNFDIQIPKTQGDDVSMFSYSRIHSDDGIEESRMTGSHFGSDDRVDNSVNETDYDIEEGTRHTLLQGKSGINMLQDWGEYTMPLKGDEMDRRSPVISEKSYRNLSNYKGDRSHRGNISLEEMFERQQSGRERDSRRMGRWSEGHKSRLQSPGQRSIEHDRRSMPGQINMDTYLSSQHEMRRDEFTQSQRQNSQINNSVIMESSKYDRHNERSRNLSSRSTDMISRMSSRQNDNIVDALPQSRNRSLDANLDDLYTAQKLEYSTREVLHQSIPNISSKFSPRISSTQRNMETDYDDDDDDDDDDDERPPSNVSASPIVSPISSPRSVTPTSTSRLSRALMPSNRDNQTIPNSPTSSARSLSSRNSSRRSSLRDHTPRASTPTSGGSRHGSRVLMTSNRDNQSIAVSPTGSARSLSSRNSSRLSAVRDTTPRQILTPISGGSRYKTPVGSGNQSKSMDHSPLQTVTPSPVVSPGDISMSESRSSIDLQPSVRKSRSHLDDSLQRSQREDKQRLERSSSSINRSLNRSRGQASPNVAGRGLAPDMVNTLPNNTVNFSPQVASTQNLATMSRTGPGTVNKSSRGDTENVDVVDDEDHNDEHDDNDEQWQDEMDGEQEVIENQQSQGNSVPMVVEPVIEPMPVPKPKKKVERKPRVKSNYSLPVNVVKKQFTHFAGMRVSKEAIEEVMKVSEKYWDTITGDLEAYAKHAGRKQINMSDFVLLFKRQGHVTEKQGLKCLIEKFLPMEEREKLIPVARAGNRIEPKTAKIMELY